MREAFLFVLSILMPNEHVQFSYMAVMPTMAECVEVASRFDAQETHSKSCIHVRIVGEQDGRTIVMLPGGRYVLLPESI